MQRIGGFRRKTRHKLRKRRSDRGKLAITKYLQKFKVGERVFLKADSAVQKGMYFPRFHGLSGIIKGMQGNSYKVKIKDGNKEKTLLIHPVHLKK